MDAPNLRCSHCNIEFFSQDESSARCPKCLRKSYILPIDNAADDGVGEPDAKRKVLKQRIVAAVVLVGILALGGFLVLTWGDKTASKNTLAGVTSADDGAITAAIMEAGVRQDAVWIPFSVTQPVQDLVRGWAVSGSDAASMAENLLAKLQALRIEGKLSMIPPADTPQQVPLMDATAIATRLLAGESVALSSYEAASLWMAALRALSIEFVPAERQGVRNSATSVRKKEFGALVDPKGRRVFFDPYNGVSAEATSAVPLTELQFIAYGLALNAEPLRAKKQTQDAAVAVDDALRLFPDSAAILLVSGMIKVESGIPEFGIEDIAKAVSAAPDALGYYNLGVAYVQGDSQFKAFQSFKKATELDSGYGPAFLALGNLQIQRIASIPTEQREAAIAEAQGYFDRAKAADPELEGLATSEAQLLLTAGKKDEAKKILDAELQKYPNRVDPLLMLGRIAMEEERMADAADAFEKAALASPDRADVRGLLAFAYAGLEDWDRARKTLERLVEAAPEAKDVRIQLAGALKELGRLDDAKRVLSEQMAKFGDDPTAPLLLAQLAVDEKAFDTAVELARKANKTSRSFEGLVVEIIALWGANQRDAIPPLVDELARLKDNGRVVAAQTLLNQGELALAEEVLRMSKTAEPANVELAVMLAMTVFAQGRADEATTIRDQTVAAVPQDKQEELRKQFDQALDVVRTSMEELRRTAPEENP